MRFLKIARQSLQGILANKGRAGLTILGIVIGIASVIALIGIGQGATDAITGQINTLGSTNLLVVPSSGGGGGLGGPQPNQPGGGGGGGGGFGGLTASTLTEADLSALNDHVRNPAIKEAAGLISASALVQANGQESRVAASGVTPAYFDIYGLTASSGRLLGPDQNEKSVVLGSQSASDLYGGQNPLGQHLTVNGQDFTIVGVLKATAESAFRNPNNQLYLPAQAAMQLFNVANYSSLVVQATSEDTVSAAQSQTEATLLQQHNIDDPKLADFTVLSPEDLLSVTRQVTGTLTALLAGIAGISLVVGGIGIMNIMLVSVSERTREIGLRIAVGAHTGDILSQFLIEAVILTFLGSLLGIALGVGAGSLASRFLGFPAAITGGAIALAIGVAIGVGLVFGIYPAAKASGLNPIDALRYE